jgi:site-specific recombinase XerD
VARVIQARKPYATVLPQGSRALPFLVDIGKREANQFPRGGGLYRFSRLSLAYGPTRSGRVESAVQDSAIKLDWHAGAREIVGVLAALRGKAFRIVAKASAGHRTKPVPVAYRAALFSWEPAQRSRAIETSRALTTAEWATVKKYLVSMDADNRYHRLRFILVFAYSTGLRLSELASVRRKHLIRFHRLDDGVEQWQIEVAGKDGHKRTVQVSAYFMNELICYLSHRDHENLESVPQEAPLIAALLTGQRNTPACPIEAVLSVDQDSPISVHRLYKVLKRFFEEASKSEKDSTAANRLRRASTHWLRHTFATQALQSGVSLQVVRDLLGHRSPDTTSLYVTAERDRRRREIERFSKIVPI